MTAVKSLKTDQVLESEDLKELWKLVKTVGATSALMATLKVVSAAGLSLVWGEVVK